VFSAVPSLDSANPPSGIFNCLPSAMYNNNRIVAPSDQVDKEVTSMHQDTSSSNFGSSHSYVTINEDNRSDFDKLNEKAMPNRDGSNGTYLQ
jgi:hypothetical protein